MILDMKNAKIWLQIVEKDNKIYIKQGCGKIFNPCRVSQDRREFKM